jgi:basic amino acid/polyamine antiporter, APA family
VLAGVTLELVAAPSITRRSTGPVRLRGHLGLRGAVALGVGGTVGGGVFVLTGAAASAAGPGAWLAFVLAIAVVALIALPYTEVATRAPRAGGGYAFVQETLGGSWGFFMGWGYGTAWLLGSGYVTTGFGRYVHALSGLPVLPVTLALVIACIALNVFGLGPSARAQMLLTSVAVLGLAVVVFWGAGHVDTNRLTPLFPNGAHGFLFATVLAFLALNGFDAIAAASEEMRDPARTLPRAILLTLLIVGGLYVGVALVALGTMPLAALMHSPAPLADSAVRFGGGSARALVLATAVLTIAATANAMIVVSSRVMFGMARDGHLPARLGQVAAFRDTPVPSVLASGALVALVAVVAYLDGVQLIAGIAGFLYVLHYLPPLAALVLVRRQARARSPAAFTTPIPRIVIPAAIACCVLVAVASGLKSMALGSVWLVIGALYRSRTQAS